MSNESIKTTQISKEVPPVNNDLNKSPQMPNMFNDNDTVEDSSDDFVHETLSLIKKKEEISEYAKKFKIARYLIISLLSFIFVVLLGFVACILAVVIFFIYKNN